MTSTFAAPSEVALSEADRARLAPFVTSLDADVFCLRGLPEEVIAVLFAYYSRSRDTLRTNLARLLADQELGVAGGEASTARLDLAESKAREFHEKWVVGYGHASVAEHAVAHVALENISIVATKAIEDARLAAYTEKSTRYVVFDEHSFVPLANRSEASIAALYAETASHLLSTYVRLMEPVAAKIRARIPRGTGQAERAYDAAIRAQTCDVLRYLLPAGTKTNLGMTINGRALEQLLSKLSGSPLAEVRDLATEIHLQAKAILPTLLKYVAPSAHRTGLHARLQDVQGLLSIPEIPQNKADRVTLVRHDADALERVTAAIAYEPSGMTYEAIGRAVGAGDRETLIKIFSAYIADRGKFDAPLRALEHTTYTFDIVLDHGAYRDLQRHRMQTQTAQRLGMQLGYELPEAAAELGIEHEMRDAIDRAGETWAKMAAIDPESAQYIVPLAAKRRYLLTCNLRELFHLVELRSARQGHISYRRIAHDLFRAVERVHPWAAQGMRVDLVAYELARS